MKKLTSAESIITINHYKNLLESEGIPTNVRNEHLGSIVGVLVALGAAIFQFQDWLHPLMVLLVFGVGQSAEGMYLTPKLVGDQIGSVEDHALAFGRHEADWFAISARVPDGDRLAIPPTAYGTRVARAHDVRGFLNRAERLLLAARIGIAAVGRNPAISG